MLSEEAVVVARVSLIISEHRLEKGEALVN